jgi:hypothetical protein
MNDSTTRTQRYRARGGGDDQVHLVDAGTDALLDPSPYRTRCGQPVLEVYNGGPDATCPVCLDEPARDAPAQGGVPKTPDTSTTIGRRDPGRLVAFAVGAVFLLVGILGFVPGVTTGELAFAGHGSEAMLFGVFAVSVLHNLVHLALGAVGLALARTARGARVFLVGGALTYLALWLYGVLGPADVVPINGADNWLHLFLAAGMGGLAFLVGTPRRSTNTPMHPEGGER